MRCIGCGAAVLAGLLAGCGGGGNGGAGSAGVGTVPATVASPLSESRPIAVYSGRTQQGLGISAEQPDGARLTVVLGWRGSCQGQGWVGTHQPLREARFDLERVPGRSRDTKREDGGDGDSTTFLREIDVRRDGDGLSGHFRIRSRLWNGQLRDVDGLCDTGRVSFSADAVEEPRVRPFAGSRQQLAAAGFQQQLAEAVNTLRAMMGEPDRRLACQLLTARLRRTACPGGRMADSERTAALRSVGELPSARRAAPDGAVVTLPTGGERFDGANRLRDVRDLRFVAQRTGGPEPPTWLLDRIGDVRSQRVP